MRDFDFEGHPLLIMVGAYDVVWMLRMLKLEV
jgi:hypothetical protein